MSEICVTSGWASVIFPSHNSLTFSGKESSGLDKQAGAKAVLIGESLVKQEDIEAAVTTLFAA